LKIELQNISKRYSGPWIFRDLNASFGENERIGITGLNGSGKSTLLQIISGYLSATNGKVEYLHQGDKISREDIYKHLSFASPYGAMIDDYNITELFEHYRRFKKIKNNLTTKDLLDISGLINHRNKRIKHLSSGLNQRAKLILAFASDTPLLILDEPTSYLDMDTKQLYKTWMEQFGADRMIIVASNDQFDLDGSDQYFDVSTKALN